MYADTQTDVLPGEPESAICVQRFDDSLNSAIHTTYRSWLRSSSMHEPRDPPLKVVSRFSFLHIRYSRKHVDDEKKTGPGGSLGKTPFVPSVDVLERKGFQRDVRRHLKTLKVSTPKKPF